MDLERNQLMSEESEIIKFFRYDHLPERLQSVSKRFYDLAVWMDVILPKNKETDMALRKLLECKDCAVRSTL